MAGVEGFSYDGRRPGCEASARRDSDLLNVIYAPVCMGGTVLLGCNNVEECYPGFQVQFSDETMIALPIVSEGRVAHVVHVPRKPTDLG